MTVRPPLAVVLLFVLSSCAVTATRPIQEMSDTEAAVRAAREVNAHSLAPELYRQASEYLDRARREYRLKNFQDAQKFAFRSRDYAERAEFEALRAGGTRQQVPEDPLADPVSAPNEIGHYSKPPSSAPGPVAVPAPPK